MLPPVDTYVTAGHVQRRVPVAVDQTQPGAGVQQSLCKQKTKVKELPAANALKEETPPYPERQRGPSQRRSSEGCGRDRLQGPQVHHGKGGAECTQSDPQTLQRGEESCRKTDIRNTLTPPSPPPPSAYLPFASLQPVMSEPMASSSSAAHDS